MDPNEDQISNWKMEPRDCTEHRGKDQEGGKWNTEATEYGKETQMSYCLSKRHSRWKEKEKITEKIVTWRKTQQVGLIFLNNLNTS